MNIVFGVSSTRDDLDLVEEVLDALDTISDGDWEAVSWRNSGTRMIINAPVEARALIEDSGMNARIVDLGQAMEMMEDQRNEWIDPDPDDISDGTAFDTARLIVSEWMSEMFDEGEISDDHQSETLITHARAERTQRTGMRDLKSRSQDGTPSAIDEDGSSAHDDDATGTTVQGDCLPNGRREEDDGSGDDGVGDERPDAGAADAVKNEPNPEILAMFGIGPDERGDDGKPLGFFTME